MNYRGQSMNAYHITCMRFDTQMKSCKKNSLVIWIAFRNLRIQMNERNMQ